MLIIRAIIESPRPPNGMISSHFNRLVLKLRKEREMQSQRVSSSQKLGENEKMINGVS